MRFKKKRFEDSIFVEFALWRFILKIEFKVLQNPLKLLEGDIDIWKKVNILKFVSKHVTRDQK